MDFMRYKWLYFLISGLIIVPGLFSLVRWGLKPSIDFTGGAVLVIQSDKFKGNDVETRTKISSSFSKVGIKLESIQKSSDSSYTLKMENINQEKKDKALSELKNDYSNVQETSFETIGPLLGKELITKTLIAMFLATALILFYIAYRFHGNNYGICATIATIHDSIVILGTFSLLGHFKGVEVDTLFVTAVLTSISFSVHDTVVVYDRIRESVKRFPKAKYVDLINKAIAETLNRSVNNSLTIIFMLTCLWLLGGETVKWFVFALLIGTITGAYSSPFVATPLLVVWKKIKDRRKKY